MAIEFHKDFDITGLTTFHIPAKAKLYAEYSSAKELLKISRSSEFLNNEILNLGGGSNLLFVSDFDGLILHSKIKELTLYRKNEKESFVIAGAGEKWTELVEFCIANDMAGLENLAGIPGHVGASAVQNVGAYGVEAKDIIHTVECFDTQTREIVNIKGEDCGFGYRDSKFKREWKNRYIVLRVSFRVKPTSRAGNLNYGALKDLEERLGHAPSLREVSDEIISLRNSKLPDPEKTGSAGSFFKNPVVNRYILKEEIRQNEKIPFYPVNDSLVKIPAGWLIEHAGLKGYSIGGAEIWPSQCLVIANKGNATAKDVVDLADYVRFTVKKKFGINLYPEVNYIDTRIEVTVLGSGTSKGVPEPNCLCDVCQSGDPLDKRLRASVLVKTHGMTILIDPSPDFRQQALMHGITTIDAVLITHSHYDHVGGIDDLRPYCADQDLKLFVRSDVDQDLRKRIDYCFRPQLYPGVPVFDMNIIGKEPFYIKGLKIEPIEVYHGKLPILGFRIGDFAYVTDAKTIPEESKEKLEGLKVLICNALRERPHFAHQNFEEAVALINELKPEEAYLTHFNHEAGFHRNLETRFGPHIHPAFDGQTIIC